MELSPRMEWAFPSENQDPWYPSYEDQIRAQDASGFAAREDRNLILSGGGTLTWNVSTGLTWTDPFLVWSPATGFFSLLVPNTLLPQNGQCIRTEIVRAPGSNKNVAAEVANTAQNTDNSLVLGMRSGTSFLFRNGALIQDGVTIDAEDLLSGAGGVTGFTLIEAGEIVEIPAKKALVLAKTPRIEGRLVVNGNLKFIEGSRKPIVLPVIYGPTSPNVLVPNNCIVPVDPSAGSMGIQLPNSGRPGESVTVVNISDSANNIEIETSVRTIYTGVFGGEEEVNINSAGESVRLVRLSDQNWAQEI